MMIFTDSRTAINVEVSNNFLINKLNSFTHGNYSKVARSSKIPTLSVGHLQTGRRRWSVDENWNKFYWLDHRSGSIIR